MLSTASPCLLVVLGVILTGFTNCAQDFTTYPLAALESLVNEITQPENVHPSPSKNLDTKDKNPFVRFWSHSLRTPVAAWSDHYDPFGDNTKASQSEAILSLLRPSDEPKTLTQTTSRPSARPSKTSPLKMNPEEDMETAASSENPAYDEPVTQPSLYNYEYNRDGYDAAELRERNRDRDGYRPRTRSEGRSGPRQDARVDFYDPEYNRDYDSSSSYRSNRNRGHSRSQEEPSRVYDEPSRDAVRDTTRGYRGEYERGPREDESGYTGYGEETDGYDAGYDRHERGYGSERGSSGRSGYGRGHRGHSHRDGDYDRSPSSDRGYRASGSSASPSLPRPGRSAKFLPAYTEYRPEY